MTEITQVTGKDGTIRIEIITDDRSLAARAEEYVDNLRKAMHPEDERK